ncbi:MAG: alanine/ornithine racemase family PLP-dependent enzyme [Oscillospiraceae bacterium]|nr:alanine/ornithine racemase family PLP-dependent enzyme [Oscillospiraceae bacterium]
MDRHFPRLIVHEKRFRQNVEAAIARCRELDIDVCGVVKGCHALPPLARMIRDCGAVSLGTSRLEQIKRCRDAGIEGPYWLIRIPAMTELPDVVTLCDASLQSSLSTIRALEEECARRNKTHGVIVMADLGDLREGFWDKDEMVNACVSVERDMPHLHLLGIGVNLSCYGSVRPTAEKMHDLIALARRIEAVIGRPLEVVSGGATSSYTLVHDRTMPKGINNLRIGELFMVGLSTVWGITDVDYLRTDAFTLQAEVIEVDNKPSHPQGELCIDAFGRKRTYEDRGIRRRALLAFGLLDTGEVETLIPREEGITVVAASSDHCILDITDCPRDLKVGDIVEFSLRYSHLLYLTGREDVTIIYDSE